MWAEIPMFLTFGKCFMRAPYTRPLVNVKILKSNYEFISQLPRIREAKKVIKIILLF
jgi:hypothetical protein